MPAGDGPGYLISVAAADTNTCILAADQRGMGGEEICTCMENTPRTRHPGVGGLHFSLRRRKLNNYKIVNYVEDAAADIYGSWRT